MRSREIDRIAGSSRCYRRPDPRGSVQEPDGEHGPDVQAPARVPAVPAEDEVWAVADQAVDGPGHVEDDVLAAEPEGPGHVVLRDDRPDGVVEAVDRQGQPAA